MIRTALLLTVLGCVTVPGAVSAQAPALALRGMEALHPPGTWPQNPPPTSASAFAQRALLAAGGAVAGFAVAGYGVWVLKGGSDGCDLCWESTAAGFVGGILGGALATTLADGTAKGALRGSLVGAAVGLAVVGILDQASDLDEGVMTVSFALPYTFLTAYFAGR